MEKITLKALQLAGFQNADAVAKIINYVPNPKAATELLLGVYTPTVIDKQKKFRSYRYTRNNEIAEMVSIDDFANTVTYNVLKQKTKRVWYLTSEDRNNDVYVTERPEKSYDYTDKPANGFAKEQHTTSLDSFNSDWCNELSVEDAHSRINTWMMFDIVVAPYDPETLSPTEVVEF